MKKMTFDKALDSKNRRKSISLSNKTEDAQSITEVTKGFEYRIDRTPQLKVKKESPQVNIVRGIDSKTKTETFQFNVKGFYYLVTDRMIYKVHFKHSLYIKIQWKGKIFSPKKSVVLTE